MTFGLAFLNGKVFTVAFCHHANSSLKTDTTYSRFPTFSEDLLSFSSEPENSFYCIIIIIIFFSEMCWCGFMLSLEVIEIIANTYWMLTIEGTVRNPFHVLTQFDSWQHLK